MIVMVVALSVDCASGQHHLCRPDRDRCLCACHTEQPDEPLAASAVATFPPAVDGLRPAAVARTGAAGGEIGVAGSPVETSLGSAASRAAVTGSDEAEGPLKPSDHCRRPPHPNAPPSQ